MDNDYRDEFETVDDMEADIQKKKDLISKAEELSQSEDIRGAMREANGLQRQWRKIHHWESMEDEDLRNKFDALMDVIYGKQDELNAQIIKAKEDIIAKAEEIAKSTQWQKATKELTDLMTEWKQAGKAGKDIDDKLWESFNNARQTFYQRKQEHWEEMKAGFEKAKETKEALIEEAKSLEDSEQWQKTATRFKDLMTQWKLAGSAGREFEDDLWQQFNGARQAFYTRRNEFYENLHAIQNENYQAKLDIIEKAKAIEETQNYSKENTEAMKNLSQDWKAVGSCGKDKEDQIWADFRAVMDSYFNGLKDWTDKRHEDWKDRMKDAADRKKEQIETQKRQIRQLSDRSNGLISQSEMDSIENQIADKEEFIKKLESQIEDIEKKVQD